MSGHQPFQVPQGWLPTRLSEVADSITSGPRGWASYYSETGAIFLRIANLTREGLQLRFQNLAYVSPPHGAEGVRTALAPDDLLISITADLGIIGIVPPELGEAYVNQHIARARLDSGKVSVRFVGYFLASATGQKQFYRLNDAGAKAGLNLPTVGNLEICLPPIAEQARIAEVLDTLDEAIRGTRERIEKSNWIYQGMQDRFFAPIAVQNREGWQETRLEELSESITSGPRGWACYYAEEGDYFLRIGNLTRKHLDLRFDDVVLVQPPAGAEGVRTALAPGDLLISITADLGIIGVVPDWMGVAYINQHIARARLNRSRVNPRFLGYQLSGQIGQKQFYRLNDVGAKAGLNLPTVGRLKVWLPSLAEQNQIATALDTVQMSLREDEVILAKLVGLKSGLSSDLLTGRVRALETR